MKKFYKYALLFAAVCTIAGCGLLDGDEEDDDNGSDEIERIEGLPSELFSGNWDEPPFMEDAALYIVEGDDEIGRIYLSADGSYLILPANFNISEEPYARSTAEQPVKRSILHRNKAVSRAMVEFELNGQKMLSGTFSKKGQGHYELEGFGVLESITDKQIRLTRNGKERFLKVDCTKFTPNNIVERSMCSYLWHPVYGRDEYYEDGELIDGEIYSTPEQIRDEFVEFVWFQIPAIANVTWNCRGSFIQIDYDGWIDGIGGWSWIDASKNMLHYDWTDEDTYSSFVQIFLEEINGHKYCYIYEGAEANAYGHHYETHHYVKCELYKRN